MTDATIEDMATEAATVAQRQREQMQDLGVGSPVAAPEDVCINVSGAWTRAPSLSPAPSGVTPAASDVPSPLGLASAEFIAMMMHFATAEQIELPWTSEPALPAPPPRALIPADAAATGPAPGADAGAPVGAGVGAGAHDGAAGPAGGNDGQRETVPGDAAGAGDGGGAGAPGDGVHETGAADGDAGAAPGDGGRPAGGGDGGIQAFDEHGSDGDAGRNSRGTPSPGDLDGTGGDATVDLTGAAGRREL